LKKLGYVKDAAVSSVSAQWMHLYLDLLVQLMENGGM